METLAEHNRRIMHKNFNKFLQALVVFPTLMTGLAGAPVVGMPTGLPTVAVISPDQTRTLSEHLTVNQQQVIDVKVAQLQSFLAKYNLPLQGHEEKLVTAAVDNGLEPLDVALVALEESTGCKHIIPNTNNCFGWGGGKIKFKSIDEGIDTVAAALGGNNPDTDKYYDGKTRDQMFLTYNGRANPRYLRDLNLLKTQIEQMPVDQTVQTASVPTNKV